MEKELTNKMIEWIEAAGQKIGDFATQEIPPFIHEYLNWKFWEAIVNASIGFFFVILGLIWFIFFCKKVFKWSIQKDSKGYDTAWTLIPTASCVLAMCGIIFGFPYAPIKDIIQIKVAPKVFLIEKASSILKDKQ